jgi:threonine dehydrogenase-like Zn-dependent dehydrogenase
MVTDTIADPEPAPGEVLVKTLACGICGSDLHALKHGERLAEASKRAGSVFAMELDRDVVMGHEFCAEVVDHGPDTQGNLKPGTRVCSVPILLRGSGLVPIGYSNDAPGGFGEYMVLNEALLLEVPEGLSSEVAALTEPMAVGWHAVEKAQLTGEEVPLVIGCGPVGLAVIAALRVRDARPIVAVDPCEMRRRLAETLGADTVVDPGQASPYVTWEQAATLNDAGGASDVMALLGPPLKPAVIFECVGVPGMVQQILEGAARDARVVIVGVCMEEDRFEPFFGITKEISLQFVLGYTPEEFATSLGQLAEGKIHGDPVITGKVGIDGVAGAFEDLATPERHAKILIEPWRS